MIKNVDWLFFDKVYIKNHVPKDDKPKILIYTKLVFNILKSLFITSKQRERYIGGLFFIDNSRHFDQAKVIVPYLTQSFYHYNGDQDITGGQKINLTTNYLSSYKYLAKYFFYLIKSEFRCDSKVIKQNLSLGVYGLLLYEHFIQTLKNNDFKYVVILTDHSFKNRALLFAAKKLNVKTVYIPHASISTKFPPLEFDIAFLEGNDMKKKYESISESWSFPKKTEVILTGNIKINYYRNFSKNTDEATQSIGIAYNAADSLIKVQQFLEGCLLMEELTEYNFIVRPHPSVRESINLKSKRIVFSDSKKENSFSFLNKLKCLISSNSTLVLESELLNKPVFIYSFSGVERDNYSFIENKICPSLKNLNAIKEYITVDFKYNKNNNSLRDYDYSFGKDINSAEIVSEKLNSLI